MVCLSWLACVLSSVLGSAYEITSSSPFTRSTQDIRNHRVCVTPPTMCCVHGTSVVLPQPCVVFMGPVWFSPNPVVCSWDQCGSPPTLCCVHGTSVVLPQPCVVFMGPVWFSPNSVLCSWDQCGSPPTLCCVHGTSVVLPQPCTLSKPLTCSM